MSEDDGEFMPNVARQVRLYYFSNWAEEIEDALAFLHGAQDVSARVSDPQNAELVRMAQLDRDWDAASLSALAAMASYDLRLLPARIFGRNGLLELYQEAVPAEEDRWILFTGMRPLELSGAIGKLLRRYVSLGYKIFYWSYDQASYRTPNYATDIAPYLSALVHDETPLQPEVEAALNPNCVRVHRSWVANVVPFSFPFQPDAEKKIVFMGSQMGVTDQRRQAIEALAQHFKDRFIAFTNHSVPISERANFGRFKVHFCPEGRHFTDFTMRLTHTDRVFWAGCAGQVPVVEDSKWGGRLEDLAAEALIFRYAHGDLKGMIEGCEAALEAPLRQRERIYQHFNAHETIGTVVEGVISKHQRASSV